MADTTNIYVAIEKSNYINNFNSEFAYFDKEKVENLFIFKCWVNGSQQTTLNEEGKEVMSDWAIFKLPKASRSNGLTEEKITDFLVYCIRKKIIEFVVGINIQFTAVNNNGEITDGEITDDFETEKKNDDPIDGHKNVYQQQSQQEALKNLNKKPHIISTPIRGQVIQSVTTTTFKKMVNKNWYEEYLPTQIVQKKYE